MCGIAGFLNRNSAFTRETQLRVARDMATTLRHRGPDDAGVWVDPESGIALGHRRLSIIDLSAAGHQPMISASGRFVATFNGEIYNFQELRNELERSNEGVHFLGHSDTEVMLACIEHWGWQASLKRWNGMFALAVWDRQTQTLHLARDRFGEKPLYYTWQGHSFLFASELSALRAHPDFRAEIDRDALALYLRYSYVPAPMTIYRGVFKLPPATSLSITADLSSSAVPSAFWSLPDVAIAGVNNPFQGSPQDAADQLDSLLRDSIKLRMESDVPLGVFLSGGVDSSTVTALMQAQLTRRVKSFSIGFLESDFNEAGSAKLVANHLQTDHTELYVTPKEARDVIPLLPAIYDEPFADSSQIPTFLLAKLTRHHVKVSLSGDGGDEIFGGYNRHLWGCQLQRVMNYTPLAARRAFASLVSTIKPSNWNRFYSFYCSFRPAHKKHTLIGEKLYKFAAASSADDLPSAYLRLCSQFPNPNSIVLGSRNSSPSLTHSAVSQLPSFTEQMMFLDTLLYLPDDILTKVDRATMAVSLESRTPFLDHRIVEFAWRLPPSMKIAAGKGKCVLRDVLLRYVPSSLIDRPKTGFAVPLESWLRGPLRDWAEELLSEQRLRVDQFFDPISVRNLWSNFLSGRANTHSQVWNVLMFQAWLDSQARLPFESTTLTANAN
jgi:asparagine synthase (glutamine-hydrolysing)